MFLNVLRPEVNISPVLGRYIFRLHGFSENVYYGSLNVLLGGFINILRTEIVPYLKVIKQHSEKHSLNVVNVLNKT